MRIKEKSECCGCGACAQVCPKHCISMHMDEEGFLYPIVEQKDCVGCNLCEKVCPVLKSLDCHIPQSVYAAFNESDEERMNSSSGGIFVLLAKYVLQKGGVVFGSMFDDKWNVIHGYVENESDLCKMMGSKYVQSRIGNAYCDVLKFLKEERIVLFTGTPCQIAGLKSFLRKDYDNLYLVDVLCHGAPSPGVWISYVAELEKKMPIEKCYRKANAGEYTVLTSSLNAKTIIGDIKFRDKTEGWEKYRFVVCKKSVSKADRTSIVLSDIHTSNPYVQGMLAHLFIRPVCHKCPFRLQRSGSCMSLGDFWGIEKKDSRFGDDKGCSLVLINNDRGIELWDKVSHQTFCVRKNYDEATSVCNMIEKPCACNPKRNMFFKEFKEKASVSQIVNDCINKSYSKSFKRWIRSIMPFRILVDAPGQTCNRFWAYLDSIGWAIVNKKKVIIWFWDSSIVDFDNLRTNQYVSFPFYNQHIVKLIGARNLQRVLWKFLNNRFLRNWYRTKFAKRLGFYESWPLRKSFDYYPRVKDILKSVYRPNQEICSKVDKKIQQYKNEGYFIIGIHIRRGDYRTFEGGKYYLEFSEYRDLMFSLNNLYKEKKIAFFISTNEKYDPALFADLTICQMHNTSAAQDLYTLSLCDRIIGPLSTFSRWASWYGNVPLAFFERGMKCITDDSFSVISDFYHFRNGNEIENLSDRI